MKFDTKASLFVFFALPLFSVLASANSPNDDGQDIPTNTGNVIEKLSGLNLNVFEAELCLEILIQMMLVIYTFILRCNAVFNPEESVESVTKLKLILLYVEKHSQFSDKKKMTSPNRLECINETLNPLLETDLMYQMENSSKYNGVCIFEFLNERLNEITTTLEILIKLLKLMIIKKVNLGYSVVAKKMISLYSEYRLLLKKSLNLYRKMSKGKFLQQCETTKEVVYTISINLIYGINILKPIQELLSNHKKNLIMQNSTGLKTSNSNRSSEKDDSNKGNKQKFPENTELNQYIFKIETIVIFSFEIILFAIENFFFFNSSIAKESLSKHKEIYDKVKQEILARSTELLLTEEEAHKIKVNVRNFLAIDQLLQTDNSVFSFDRQLNQKIIISKLLKLIERLKILLLYLKQENINEKRNSYINFLLRNTIVYLEERIPVFETAVVLFQEQDIDYLLGFINKNSQELLANARKTIVESSTSKEPHTSRKTKMNRFQNIESACATTSVPTNENVREVDPKSRASDLSKTKKSKSMRKQLKMELLLSQEKASEKKSVISKTIKEQKTSNQKQSKRDKIRNRAEKWQRQRQKEEDERRREREEEARKKREKEEKFELSRLTRVVTKIEQNFEAVNMEIQMRESLQSLFLNMFNLLSRITESENIQNGRESSNNIFEGRESASASLETNIPSQPHVATQSTTNFVGGSRVKRRAYETHRQPLAASTLDLIAKSRNTNEASDSGSQSLDIASEEIKSLETTQADSGDKLRSKNEKQSKAFSRSKSRSTRSRTRSRGRSRTESRGRSISRAESRGRSKSRTESRGRSKSRTESRSRSKSRTESRSRSRSRSRNNLECEIGYLFERPLTKVEDFGGTKNIESKLLKLFSNFESNESEDSAQTDESNEQFLFGFFGIKKFDYSKFTIETPTHELEAAISEINLELIKINENVIPLLTGKDYETVKSFERQMIRELIKLLIMLNNVSEKYK
ncbi:putative Secreted Protein (CpLSP gene family) [Cryptosporidium meleagridis]